MQKKRGQCIFFSNKINLNSLKHTHKHTKAALDFNFSKKKNNYNEKYLFQGFLNNFEFI